MKKIRLLLFVSLVIGLLSACSTKLNTEIKENEEVEKTNIPTLFLHGYSGTNRTMKTMINKLEKQGIATDEMTISVSDLGDISVETDVEGAFKKNNPMINVVFENSKSDQWQQAEWLKIVLMYLKTSHQVEAVNIVGFSMGGISSFLYTETFSGEEMQPVVQKLVAIGAPFNEFLEIEGQEEADIIENGPEVVSDQLTNYIQLIDGVPKETSFFLVGGQLSEINVSDGTVSLNSSLGIYSLLEKNKLQVKYQVITGSSGQHSALRKNNTVINKIGKYLWQE